MAYGQMVAVLVLLIVALPPLIGAIDHVVGDDQGWAMDFNYNAWAEGRQFFVGDKLIFKYRRGDHNVYPVDQASFKDCAVPPTVKPLVSGNDVVTLLTPGKKWYICGIPVHCSVAGQKLEITVLPESLDPTSPHSTAVPPISSGNGKKIARSYVTTVVIVVISLIVMV